MSNTDSPAVARRRVRLALRQAREARRLTQSQVAEAMEWSLSKVMRIEKGDVSISASDLRVLLDYLDVTDVTEVKRLLDDARTSRTDRWAADAQYRDQISPATLQLLQFEAEATAIRYYNNIVVPGPFQTARYARAIFDSHNDDLDEATVAARIEVRLRRREHTLYRPEPPNYLAILDESVLWREVGGPAVMGEQLAELLRIMEETKVQIRVVPFASAAGIAFLGPFTILSLGDEENAVLYREGYRTEDIVHLRREVNRHRDVFERLWPVALSDSDSAELIRRRGAAMLSAVPDHAPA
jgi:transcriptional regulator with XRE-family HTH domain